jgi:glycosyltransferase 2 family protein
LKKKRKIGFFLLLRLLGIVLFVFILTRVETGQIAVVLKAANFHLLIWGVFFQLLVLLSKGIRWHVMNDGRTEKVFWIRSLGRFFESYAIGVVTPGRLGEIIKAGHEKEKSDRVNTFVRVISERGFDMGIFIFVAASALIFGAAIQLNTFYTYLITFVAISLIVISWLLLSSVKIKILLQEMVRFFTKNRVDITIQGKRYRKGTVIMIFVLSLVSNYSYFVSCYFLARCVGLDIGFVDTGAGVALAGLVNMLPVTVMGLGTRELIFLQIFNGYAQSLVLAFSIAVFLVAQIGGGLVSMILGQLFLFWDRKRK